VLILRDVLAWRAAEVAELLETSTAAVNSALQRARAQLELIAPGEDDPADPLGPAQQVLLEQYVKAFENADIDALVRLLRADVTLEMPPEVTWFAGRESVGRFIAERIFVRPGLMHLLPTMANAQPALAAYVRADNGLLHAHALQVLAIRSGQIAGITAFRQPSLFAAFGLPTVLERPAIPAV
jgi:RNA polymerase sigma-70 factor (ECF subfamily)